MDNLDIIAPLVSIRVNDAPPNIKNIGEYCKQQACWSSVSDLKINIPDSIKLALVSSEKLKEIKSDAIAIKKIDKDIEFETKLFKLIPKINEIIEFASSRNLLTPMADSALKKLLAGNIVMASVEKKAVAALFQRMGEIGYEFNT